MTLTPIVTCNALAPAAAGALAVTPPPAGSASVPAGAAALLPPLLRDKVV